MKKLWLAIILIVFIFLGVHYYNNSSPSRIIARVNKDKKNGTKKLTYRLYFLGIIPLADYSFEIIEPETIKLEGKADIYSKYKKIYDISVRMSSIMDNKSLLPITYEYHLFRCHRENIDEKVEFNRDKNIALINDASYSIKPDTQDPLTCFYKMMHNNYKADDLVDIHLYSTNKRFYILNSKIEEEKLKINKDIYNLLIANNRVGKDNGSYYNKVNVKIVMLKEEGVNIPILIDISFRGINIKVKLIERS